jgi:P27 family predicted phage terminase small subunit
VKGRKGRPAHLTLAAGNPGRRPVNTAEPSPPVSPTVPACPDWIGDYGRALWEQQAPISHKIGTLTDADVPAFTAWCEAWDTYRRAVDALKDTLTHLTPNNGESARPEAALRKQALADWTRLGAELGFSPASRTRIKANPPNAHINPIDAFKAQRPARPA